MSDLFIDRTTIIIQMILTYFESVYVSKHKINNHQYNKKMKVSDGVMIEGFGQIYIGIMLLIILFFLIIKS